MSWQVGAFAVIGLALAGGFAWYERVRPDARIIALVGTLAAFAALGRIAFAALPNIKPTTDIVLISGYALGGGPGFAVGALAGLTSNFFFGQGPWTPWQMAAWGATGVFGAGLAWVTTARRRNSPRIGRWPLALACCAAGFAFTGVQDVGDWVTFSDHSATQLGVYVGQGLGFDAIHAAGCLVFALAFGPALIRSIQRFARRLQVTWLPPGGVVAPLIAAVLVPAAILGPRLPEARAAGPGAGAAASYLLGAENSDGGFGPAPGQPSDQLYAGWAALGLASAGYDLNRVAHGAGGLIAYVRAGAGSLSDVGSLERTILVARAAGLSARAFSGHDLVAQLQGRFRPDGSVADQVNLTTFAVLALRGAGVSPGGRTSSWLLGQQHRDGGYGFAGAGGSSDVDDTGAALEALAGDGATASGARARAVAFLRRQQNRDGGYPAQPGGQSNSQSTAWAVQGLDAAGVDPAGRHRAGAPSPLAYLNSLIAPDGHVDYSRGTDQTPVWVTAEALMAIEGKPLPLAAPPVPVAAGTLGTPPRGAGAPTVVHRHRTRRDAPRRAAVHRSRVSSRARRAAREDRLLAAAGTQIGRLASTAGLVTALVLAPVGLG